MKTINISTDGIQAGASLNDSTTANLFWNELPIKGIVNLWGNEIYFSTGLQSNLESGASDVVLSGDIAYWPPGTAFCIFYGLTPASLGEEIRAASEVNVIGKITGDEEVFKAVANGTRITITKSNHQE
jgi:hypothetical protein